MNPREHSKFWPIFSCNLLYIIYTINSFIIHCANFFNCWNMEDIDSKKNLRKRERSDDDKTEDGPVEKIVAKIAKLADEHLKSLIDFDCNFTQSVEICPLQELQDYFEKIPVEKELERAAFLFNALGPSLYHDQVDKFEFLFYHPLVLKYNLLGGDAPRAMKLHPLLRPARIVNLTDMACEQGAYHCLSLILTDNYPAAKQLEGAGFKLFVNHFNRLYYDPTGCNTSHWVCMAMLANEYTCREALKVKLEMLQEEVASEPLSVKITETGVQFQGVKKESKLLNFLLPFACLIKKD